MEYYFVGFPKRRNYSRSSGDILHSSKIKVSSCQNHPTRPETGKKWKTYQNRTLTKKEFFGGKWREYGRNKRKYDRLGKSLQERARLNTILWYFPQGEIILRVLEIPCNLQKPKWAAARTIQLAQKLEKNEKPIKTERFPKMSSLEGNEGNMGEIMGKYDRLGKSLQENARLNTIPWDFPRGEIILGVLEIPCTHQKSKWAAASWKKTLNTECFPFHTHSHRVFFGRKWRECERNVGKYEKNGNR